MSFLGSLLKPQHLPAASKTAQSIAVASCSSKRRKPCQEHHTERLQCLDNIDGRAAAGGRTVGRSLEDFFIKALVTAGSCSRHSTTVLSIPRTGRKIRNLHDEQKTALRRGNARCFSSHRPQRQSAAAVAAEVPALPENPKNEYTELVNTYPSFVKRKSRTYPKKSAAVTKETEDSQDEPSRHYPLAPRLVLTPTQEVQEGYRERAVLEPQSKEHAARIKRLRNLLIIDNSGKHEKVWAAYEQLRDWSPPMRYLYTKTVLAMFQHFSLIEFRHSEKTMRRYFSLLDEAVAEKIPLPPFVWNTGISFAGRWTRNVTNAEVKAAVETWMRMEQYGVQADHVTLNVLFHVAVKAGRFALADTIFNELKQRNMPLNRYFRASVIHYAGMRGDGDGVRQAFRDLVNAGDIVDTAVMNCVILGLIRAGEAPAAENVFLRMKKLFEDKFGTLNPKDWRKRRELGRILNETGDRLRREKHQHESSFFGAPFASEGHREKIQQTSPIAPDAATYRILIKYHAYTSGNIDKIRELLAEMQGSGLHVHGSVYFHLLRGFVTHGGYAFSPWSVSSLEELWKEILATSMRSTPARDVIKPQPTPATLDADHPIQDEMSDAGDDDDTATTDLLGAMLAGQTTAARTHKLFDLKPDNRDVDVAGPGIEHDEAEDEDIYDSELERPTYFTKGMAYAAVDAFYKCVGCKRMLEVWDEVQARWKTASEEDRAALQKAVDRHVAEDGIYRV